MTPSPTSTTEELAPAVARRGRWRRPRRRDPAGEELPDRAPRRRRRLIAAAALAVVGVAVVLVITDPFHSPSSAPGGVSDNEYPTSATSIERESLTQQTTVSGTLGFAGDTTIRLPAGTDPSAVTQAQQMVTTDQGMVSSAQAALSSDTAALSQDQATLTANEQQESVDCAGDSAAQAAASGAAGSGGASGACAAAAQLVSAGQQGETADAGKVAADQHTLTSAQQSLAGAQGDLATAAAEQTAYGQSSTFTAIPSGGLVVHRGQQLYAIDGQPVLLLYGGVPASRAFFLGMSPGPDVAELNRNLDRLGYAQGLSGDNFTSATEGAIRALQGAAGANSTGQLLLGSVVFESGPVRVTSVMGTIGVGSAVMPGPVMTVSSTARQVQIQLDAALQGEVTVGDAVIITLPDNQTTPGRISYVSAVASQGQGGSTILVDAVPTHPAATGNLDQAPVNVSIITGSVRNVLVVPVDALLALGSGGYAVEEIGAGGARHLVAVTTGLFDDADGLVQVSGSGLAAGQRVVVPGV